MKLKKMNSRETDFTLDRGQFYMMAKIEGRQIIMGQIGMRD